MAARYRVEKQENLDGTASWHVLDARQDGQPAAEFDDEESARDHAARLERQESPTDDGDEAGDAAPPVP